MYQVTMAYAYWRAGRQDEHAVFDLFFRKCPFKGQFTIFAGLSEVIALLNSFSFSASDIAYLRTVLPQCEEAFFVWLGQLDCQGVRVYSLEEGSLCFPRVPLIRVEGPLAVAQLLETPLLNLINFPSLIATNAARLRVAAGSDKKLLEFGLRRAQGPDGALSASRYSYIGGFDATSNVLAGKLIGIDVRGTHAHSFVQTYTSFEQACPRRHQLYSSVVFDEFDSKVLRISEEDTVKAGGALLSVVILELTFSAPAWRRYCASYIKDPALDGKDFVAIVKEYRNRLGSKASGSNEGELAAFTAYAQAFPDGFVGLVDTYDTLQSGVPNFLCVALALDDLGHRALGCRLDSGDLSYLSQEVRKMTTEASKSFDRPFLATTNIMASNDINEESLQSLADQGHAIDTFGIGTNLVTCQSQPALGCVYKLVSIEGVPRIKLSQTTSKITIPGRKEVYRLLAADEVPILDIMIKDGEEQPQPGVPILARHPFVATKRARVTASQVIRLQKLVWDGQAGGVTSEMPSIHEVRATVADGLKKIRPDTLQRLNPTPYKVSVSEGLHDFLHSLWEKEAPIRELS
ncbi:unnamed protein product [Pylaiella littoralis]